MSRIITFLKNRQVIFRGSAILSSMTLLSYLIGLLRDRMLAHTFGASTSLDAYKAAFVMPDLLLNIFVAGAMTAAFVPIITELRERGDHASSRDFINSVLNSSTSILLLTGVAVFVFARPLSNLIVPGFDEPGRLLFIHMTRLLLLSPIIFSISNLFGNLLVSEQRYFWYGFSAVLYNVGIIVGILFLTPSMGILGVAWGAIIGALMHFIVRAIHFGHVIRGYRPRIRLSGDYLKFLRIMLPKLFGHPTEQLINLGFTTISSTLGVGAIAILGFARNFQSMPINVIGISFALTAFPVLSRAAAQRNKQDFWKEIVSNSKIILLLTILAALATYGLRFFVIRFFLGTGAFTPEDVRATAIMLGLFSLSIPTESMNHLLARGFYALKNSYIPVLLSLGGLTIALTLGYYLSRTHGIYGLPIGFFVGSGTEMIALFLLLRRFKEKHF